MRKFTMNELFNNVTEKAITGATIGGMVGKALEDKIEVAQYIPGVNIVAKAVKLSTTSVSILTGLTIGAVYGAGETIIDATKMAE